MHCSTILSGAAPTLSPTTASPTDPPVSMEFLFIACLFVQNTIRSRTYTHLLSLLQSETPTDSPTDEPTTANPTLSPSVDPTKAPSYSPTVSREYSTVMFICNIRIFISYSFLCCNSQIFLQQLSQHLKVLPQLCLYLRRCHY